MKPIFSEASSEIQTMLEHLSTHFDFQSAFSTPIFAYPCPTTMYWPYCPFFCDFIVSSLCSLSCFRSCATCSISRTSSPSSFSKRFKICQSAPTNHNVLSSSLRYNSSTMQLLLVMCMLLLADLGMASLDRWISHRGWWMVMVHWERTNKTQKKEEEKVTEGAIWSTHP